MSINEIRDEYNRNKKTLSELKAKDLQPNRDAAQTASDSEKFVALQQINIDIITKYPELGKADTHRPIIASEALGNPDDPNDPHNKPRH